MSNNKTERKNKVSLDVIWPTTPYFTFEELWTLNSQSIPITLRSRLTDARKLGRVVEIGNHTGAQGRPLKVYALTPVSEETLNKTKNENIVLVPNAKDLVGKVTLVKTPPVTNIIQPSSVAVA